jgi:hypothetical protein
MANIFLEIGKGIEVGAEDLLKWVTGAQKAAPAALAALGVLAAAVAKSLSDAEAIAGNPASFTITLATDVTDFKASWADTVKFLETLGVKL